MMQFLPSKMMELYKILDLVMDGVKVVILDQVKREVVLVFLVQDQLQRGWYSLSMFLHRFLKCNLA